MSGLYCARLRRCRSFRKTFMARKSSCLPIFYSGAVADAEKLIAPLRAFGTAHGEHLGAQPYSCVAKGFRPVVDARRKKLLEVA